MDFVTFLFFLFNQDVKRSKRFTGDAKIGSTTDDVNEPTTQLFNSDFLIRRLNNSRFAKYDTIIAVTIRNFVNHGFEAEKVGFVTTSVSFEFDTLRVTVT